MAKSVKIWRYFDYIGYNWIQNVFLSQPAVRILFFSGSQNLSINAGGRLTIPTKYRDMIMSDEYNGQMFLTSHLSEDCLVLYPKAKFNDIADQIRDIEDTATAEVYNDLLIAPAVETEMDVQGRIMIPPSLRKIAGLEKEVALVGKTDSFQLWDAGAWETRFYDSKAQAKELLKRGEVRLKL